jgi:uncharacterized protein with PQ loop repeat
MNNQPLHHVSIRRRIYEKLEAYPSNKKIARLVDEGGYIFGIAGPLFSIPQLYAIWSTQNADGVSLFSWSAFTLGALFWIFYGIMHKEKPIIISQILWFFLQLGIVIGIILYK